MEKTIETLRGSNNDYGCFCFHNCVVVLRTPDSDPFLEALEPPTSIFFLVEPSRPAIPMLLVVGAVHQHLIENGLRMSASIIADTAQCFSTHHFACLIGYGASDICPHLALETCRQWRLSNKTVNMMRNRKMPIVTMDHAQKSYRKVLLQEKKRGKALDSVANFHLQNGANAEAVCP